MRRTSLFLTILALALATAGAADEPVKALVGGRLIDDVIAGRGDVQRHVALLADVDVVLKRGIRYK